MYIHMQINMCSLKSHVEYDVLYLAYIPTCLDAFDYISLMLVHASNYTHVNGQSFFLFGLPVDIGEHDSFGQSEFYLCRAD